MNDSEIITEVQNRTKRTDKDSTIVSGINWGNIELAKAGISIFDGIDTSISLASGTYAYPIAISDFFLLRYYPYVSYANQLYKLEKTSVDAIVNDYLSGGRGTPTRYCISGMSGGYRVMNIGYPCPGSAATLYLFYVKKPTAASVGSAATPDVVSAFGSLGDEYLCSCGEYFVWQSLNQDKNELNEVVNNILVAKNRVLAYKADIISADVHDDKPVALPDTFY